MDFREYLKNSRVAIEKELDKFHKSSLRDAGNLSKLLEPLIKTTIEASAGGKRLRGALVRLGFQLSGKKPGAAILKPAIAFELFQTAILSHDDIIDKSPLRRGRPTIYQALGGDHYGISQTICLGDLGFFQSLQLILDSDFPQQNKNLATKSFTKTMIDTTLGEILDIEIPHLETVSKEEDVLNIFRLKTSRYTFTGPLILGAILGGGEKKLLDSLEEFGQNLGVAYQIKDDILGVFGEEKEIGKSNTSDINEGKTTLLYIFALKNAKPSQVKFLKEKYGKNSLKVEDFKEIKKIFTQSGALDYSDALALQYVTKAKSIIPRITKDKKYQLILEQMADFLVERRK